jgi:ribosome-associated protein
MAEKRAKTVRSAKKSPARSARKAAPKATKPVSKKVAALPRKTKPIDGVVAVVERALDDIKAVNVRVLDVRKLTDIADTLVIASGNSDRHVRSIADRVVEFAKKAGYRPMGVEGERDGEWVLVDLQDVIVHIMLPRMREFYRLESLWDVSAARREAAAGGE